MPVKLHIPASIGNPVSKFNVSILGENIICGTGESSLEAYVNVEIQDYEYFGGLLTNCHSFTDHHHHQQQQGVCNMTCICGHTCQFLLLFTTAENSAVQSICEITFNWVDSENKIYAVQCLVFMWSPYCWSSMEIIPMHTTLCGDYLCAHYFYVPRLIIASQWVMMLLGDAHYYITMGYGIDR